MKTLTIILALFLISACGTARYSQMDNYRYSNNPKKAYERAYKPNYVDFTKLKRWKE